MNVNTKQAQAAITATEELQQKVRGLQAEIKITDVQIAAINSAMESHNSAELMVTARSFLATASPEKRRAQFNGVLAMLEALK